MHDKTETSKAIVTSASNKFFPSILNFIGSIKANYPNHPQIYVYDLGLHEAFIKQLRELDIIVLDIPHFVDHWRSCYTWKTYILNTPLADLNFYVDAGNQILKPFDEIFSKIDTQGYLLVSQGPEVLVKSITPPEYMSIFDIDEKNNSHEIIAAGIFGFKKDSELIKKVTQKLYDSALCGLSIGFSATEQWKNKGKNKNSFIRNCKQFRHDTTLITLLVLKYIENPIIESISNFSGEKTSNSNQYMWNLRMNFSKLQYVQGLRLHFSTKIFIKLFLFAKSVNSLIKFGKI